MHHDSVASLSAALHSRRISSAELTRVYLERIRRLDPRLNGYLTLTEAQALAAAREADRRLASGDAGPLAGIPVAHKDIFCTDGVRTTCGSRILETFIAPYDATVVARVKAAGMVMLGKTNMDEFAMGSSSETSYFGPVRNPWSLERVPGGSSGGSAAAIAARLAPLATGTDTGGSIRQPAALCGVTGLKPTYGRVSRYGMIAFASSLDQAGPLGRSAEDVAYLLGAMAGFDEHDSTSVERAVEDYVGSLDQSIEGLCIGLPTEHFSEGLDAGVASAISETIRTYERLGAKVREISLPSSSLSIPAYYVVAPAEASSNLARYDGVRYGYRTPNPASLEEMYKQTRSEGFGPEVKRRIMVGTYALSAGYYDAYYLKAQKLRRLISDEFQAAFREVDVIMGPTTPTPAFKLGEKVADPVTMYLNDIFTNAANLAGLPAISVPAGFVDGLPVGLQIIGDYFAEARLLGVAHAYQRETDWHTRVPPGFE
jgi:aspartyl-tRNA(Asn)/glutamyl-tRNA(Gln) amidotransferase subunit A